MSSFFRPLLSETLKEIMHKAYERIISAVVLRRKSLADVLF
ncbi:hypothetical protein BCBMB205_25290 [Bacillus sp. CN2]|nr:hypothetical protein BCBMB205_25290 [Bacillus velezensis]ARZ58871.1 hypothetical protein BAGQ_2639 [Bacillus velezensis]GFR55850.1 hypothetical protein BCBMB205_25290 [Bacillus sp. CN2]